MSNPQVKYRHRPEVSLEAESDTARVNKLVDAAISAGKRTQLGVALYAGISEGEARTHLVARGFKVKPQ